MTTHHENKPKAQRAAKRHQVDIALLTSLLTVLPPCILALVELIKTGHDLGWW